MKTNNSTLQLFGISLIPAANIRFKSFFGLFTIFFLVKSLASFAGDKENSAVLTPAGNYSSVLKLNVSPSTGAESIRTNLYLVNTNNTTVLADGVLTEYNNLYHDSVYLEDAFKFTNINENLGLVRYGTVLAVERRPIISTNDSLFLKLWKTTRRNYQFEFITINLDHPGMEAFLEDAYLGTRSLLVLNGTTKVNFSVNTDVASASVNRFRIVYKTTLAQGPLPVTIRSVNGTLLGSKISVDWKVENEINVENYEVERSANGTDFSIVYAVDAGRVNGAFNNYSWIDGNPVSGNNYYRIKSVDRDGSKKLSFIIRVTTGKTGTGSIKIYPNPIKGNMVNLQFINQSLGIYQVRMINNEGELVYSGRLPVSSGNTSQTLFTNKKLAGGIYQLEIKAPDNCVLIAKAIVQE